MKTAEGMALDAATEHWTAREWLQIWLDTEVKPTLKACTHERYGQVVRKHLVPLLGHQKLRQLSPTDMCVYMQRKLESGPSARTVGNHHIVLRQALEIAYR